jgi:hypothetical protein
MRPTALVVPGLLAAASCVGAFPVAEGPEGQQQPLFAEPSVAQGPSRITNNIDVLKRELLRLSLVIKGY